MTLGSPNVTILDVVKHIKTTPSTVRRALNSLVEKELLFKSPLEEKNVEYFNYNALDLFDK